MDLYLKNEITKKHIHREVYEQNVGKIPYGYEIHHIDKNKHNNALSNLIALPVAFHQLLHRLDNKGIVLKDKRDISIALSFYNEGKKKVKLYENI